MSTATNKGSQVVYDKYRQALQASLVAKSKQDLVRPGIVSGCEVSIFSGTAVRIANGIFAIADGEHTVVIHKGALYDLTVDGTSEYIVARYTYSDAEAWYADFLNVATPDPTDVILGKVVYTLGVATGIDLSETMSAFLRYDYEIFVTASGKNDTLKNLIELGNLVVGSANHIGIDQVWLGSSSLEYPEESYLHEVLPVITLLKSRASKFYFRIKAAQPIDILFKLRFAMDSATSGLVRLKLSYLALSSGADITSITWLGDTSETVVCPTTAEEVVELSTTNLKIPSSVTGVEDRTIICMLERDYLHANDTHTGKMHLIDLIALV